MVKILPLFFFLLPLPVVSQGLLLNGTFEEPNTCTEYSIECAPEAWISSNRGPNNSYIKDANRCQQGQYCMAIEAGHRSKPYQRTFIRSQLVCGLKKGNHSIGSDFLLNLLMQYWIAPVFILVPLILYWNESLCINYLLHFSWVITIVSVETVAGSRL